MPILRCPARFFSAAAPASCHAFWAHYHGGLAPQVWIANLADSSVEKVPHENASDFNPMWVGNKIYFLSARAEPISLYVYDIGTKKVSEVVQNSGMDMMSASAGPGAIVYEQFGSLHLYDLASGHQHEVHVTIAGDFPEVRPHFEKVADHILNSAISPTGARAVFEAHGEILTVPAEKGSIRNITNSPGVADREPAWSPDGKSIAYFSDRSGEYELHIKNQDGIGPARAISLGKPSSYFFQLAWSPDSRKLVYTDKRLNVWYLDLDHPTPVKVDTDTYFDFMPAIGSFLVSGQPLDRVYETAQESHAGRVCLFTGIRQVRANHRWTQRRGTRCLRQERQVSLFHGEHECGAGQSSIWI